MLKNTKVLLLINPKDRPRKAFSPVGKLGNSDRVNYTFSDHLGSTYLAVS